MSQGTNNQSALLSVDDNYFDTQPTHFTNASYSQWPMQGSRTMASSIPSPTTSIQTSMTAPPAPMQRSPSYLGMSNSNRAQRHHRVHPSPNSGLLAPPGHFSRPNIDPGTGTFDRFYDDGPWSSERLRAPTIVPNRASQSNANFQMYRDDVVSEIDSIARSDSGYHTHYARSIISNEPEHMNQELPTDITVPMGNINVNSAASSEPTEIFPLQSDQASQYSGRSGRGKEFRCSDCGEMSKCKSDHKKHMLKHQKPFKCDIRNCRRKGKGFTTINDLLRHKKSVHRVGQYQNSYQCASENCRNKAKIWPRLDNFKQHIQRMHKEEDEQELINRSMYTPTETKTPTDISMDPTLIAGIGTEKQFPNDLEDPTVGISLTPEQDPSPWTTMNANPGGFALDVHPPLPRLIIPGSGSEIIETSKSHPRLGAHSLSPRTQHQPESFQSDSTSMLSNRKRSVSRSSMDKRPRLSSAPQTKVEQQQKQHQLSKNMQASSPAVSNELEDRVLQILCGATGPKRREEKSSLGTPSTSNESGVLTLTKQELLSVSQSISNLFKQNRKTLNVPRRSSRSGSSGPIMCELCGVTLARSCDMKKHMKRHTRPYGCTYPRCHKRFGAKSDWKRHENSQHYQQEFFRCQRLSLFTGTLCADLFPREQDFSRHLEKDHKLNLSKKEFQCEISECRIGRNYQCQFWCGFCEKIVKLNEERNAAWDERFDHIDSHFNKEKKRIENWLCMDAKKKKGEVYRDIESSKHAEEESEASGGGEPDETPSPDAPGARQNVQEDVQMQNNSNPTTSAADLMATYTSEVSRKRRAPEAALSHSSSSTKRQRVSLSRYCCLCNNGPWEYSTYAHCILCGHELCTTCMAINHVATEGID